MDQPIVSIICITYNHEKYIREALTGFISQQTTFPVEIVISDDCSSDSTRSIIEEYKQEYPDLFHDVSPTRNFGAFANNVYTQGQAKGRYIAICEGDDYWTDPLKLQKQVDFMEAHPGCTVSFHRYNILNQEKQTWRKDACDIYMSQNDTAVRLTIPMYLAHWVTQPCTMMYRNGTYIGLDKPYHTYKDQHQIFHLLNEGEGYILNFNGATYREHKGGIHSKTQILSQSRLAVEVAQDLYDCNGKTPALKANLINTLDWAIEMEKQHEKKKETIMYSLIWKRFRLSLSIKHLYKHLLYYLKHS